MTTPFIPPNAPGPVYSRDSANNPSGFQGPGGTLLAQRAFGPAIVPWTPVLLSKTRNVTLLGSDTSLCDANGNYRFAGMQADGTSFSPTFFESSASSVNNPNGYARTPIAIGGTGGGGIKAVASFNASFATNVMTAAAPDQPILPYAVVTGAGIAAGTYVLPYGTSGSTGTGGAGTYILSTSPGTIGSEACTAEYHFVERVACTIDTSSQTDPAMKNAWRLRCGGAHVNVSNHGRNQITAPTFTPYKHYTHTYEFCFDPTNLSSTGSAAETLTPTSDTMDDCLLYQVHQFNSSQPPESDQISLGVPVFSLLSKNGGRRHYFSIKRCDENMGSIQLDGAGNPYTAFDQGDNMTGLITWSWDVPLGHFVKYTFDFFLDYKGIRDGGQGFMKVYAGNQLVVEYYGPTLQPLRAVDHQPQIVDCEVSFGMYFYNTAFDVVATNTVNQSLIASANNYNPFREKALLIRQFQTYGG